MMNMTKNNLTVSDIIAFVHKAMKNNMDISILERDKEISEIDVRREDKIAICFYFFKNSLAIHSLSGFLEKEYSYTDRERLNLRALALEIKEYRETQAAKLFNNFFTPNNTPTSIDDLNDNDD